MADLQLSMALPRNPRVLPLIEGTVRPDGIQPLITPYAGSASEVFWRQLKFADFDVSEMSLSSLMMQASAGRPDWVALPVFPTRRFFHSQTLVRVDSGIQEPKDLVGKRVGVPEYQQTAALWTRGAFEHEFGVKPRDIIWFMERTEERSHGGSTGFQPPADISFHRIPPHQSIASMLLSGELDASIVFIRLKNLVDRSSALDFKDHHQVKPLFPDSTQENIRYYQKTGLFPINHCVVVRRSVAERHPWVLLNLYKAFLEAKQTYADQLTEWTKDYFQLGLWRKSETQGAKTEAREDVYPYGMAANRRVLETIRDYSYEQGLTSRRVSWDELFAPGTLDL